MTRTLLIFVVLLTCATGAQQNAPTPDASNIVVTGQVLDAVTHAPVADFDVTLEKLFDSGHRIPTSYQSGFTKTDNAGRFRLDKLRDAQTSPLFRDIQSSPLSPGIFRLRDQSHLGDSAVERAASGSFLIETLPPGNYYVAAAEDRTLTSLGRQLFTRLQRTATRVTTRAGETVRVDLIVR